MYALNDFDDTYSDNNDLSMKSGSFRAGSLSYVEVGYTAATLEPTMKVMREMAANTV